MMRVGSLTFREVWAFDFEYQAPSGERPRPICLVARELASGRLVQMWEEELKRHPPPYSTGPDVLFLAFYASSELNCHLALGWPLPVNVLDLFTEFRNLTNGLPTPCGNGLLGALAYFGLDGIEALEKTELRELAMRGGPWTPGEREALLAYCQSDVDALAKLLIAMEPNLDMPRALLRGRYMKAAAQIEDTGIPIDTGTLETLRSRWAEIQGQLIKQIDVDYGVFDGGTFKRDWWARWLVNNNVPWPRLESGALALDDDTFREMARAYPTVAPIRELRVSLSQMRLNRLAVGGMVATAACYQRSGPGPVGTNRAIPNLSLALPYGCAG